MLLAALFVVNVHELSIMSQHLQCTQLAQNKLSATWEPTPNYFSIDLPDLSLVNVV